MHKYPLQLKEKYPQYNDHEICEKNGIAIESDEITESTKFWVKRLPQLYFLPTRQKKLFEEMKKIIRNEACCPICYMNSSEFVLCLHCGSNSSCIPCSLKLFEGVQPNYMDAIVVKCPKCNKNWERIGNEWKNHTINRSYRNLLDGMKTLLPDVFAAEVNQDENVAPRGPNARVPTNRELSNTPRRVLSNIPSTSADPMISTPRRVVSNSLRTRIDPPFANFPSTSSNIVNTDSPRGARLFASSPNVVNEEIIEEENSLDFI